jgi:hypothetical protein
MVIRIAAGASATTCRKETDANNAATTRLHGILPFAQRDETRRWQN